MEWFQIIISIISILISIGILFGGIGYYRQGKKKEILDGQAEEINTINILRNDVETLQKQVKELTQKVEVLNKDNAEKTRKLEEWMLVFQGRDPDMKLFMDLMRSYVNNNTPLIETIKSETVPTIKNLQRYLDKQTF